MARLTVLLTPRAGRDAIVGLETDAAGKTLLRVRVSAPPVDGRANAALERLLADGLDVPLSRVRVVAGHSARRKQVDVEGLSSEVALARAAEVAAKPRTRG